ncbi:MAG: hypothetical protein COU08_03110 [Candidatus Harrisonbacteria bacterium CG10_big_fil_rev_8_21_14_0_10_42_17]|uniref:Uncharacterized protein n=1 Tax=Candidatus Harrisonbacteria bacterium CG10_big_fil_rev_8_21_14_0_10_42_17 TaxID=1974584 RepID=A0A2M6WHK7_9BACT|nr:MAG: hypothetical protein COU08_03110 [Candidatus Harrisonbacteria bacterium CG10_big_fil_rev_8_21_14_0_10_42_17]
MIAALPAADQLEKKREKPYPFGLRIYYVQTFSTNQNYEYFDITSQKTRSVDGDSGSNLLGLLVNRDRQKYTPGAINGRGKSHRTAKKDPYYHVFVFTEAAGYQLFYYGPELWNRDFNVPSLDQQPEIYREIMLWRYKVRIDHFLIRKGTTWHHVVIRTPLYELTEEHSKPSSEEGSRIKESEKMIDDIIKSFSLRGR